MSFQNRITDRWIARDTAVDVGSVKVMADNKRDLLLSPILGGIVLAGGVGLAEKRGLGREGTPSLSLTANSIQEFFPGSLPRGVL